MADMEAEKSAPKPCAPPPPSPVVEGGMAEAVIGRAALRILQRLVGLVDFFEALLGGGVAIAAVGVTFLGEAAKRGLDVAFASAARYAEDLVVAPFAIAPPALYTALSLAARKPLVLGKGAGPVRPGAPP